MHTNLNARLRGRDRARIRATAAHQAEQRLILSGMDLDHARDFLHAHHWAVLATTRTDGRPQLSPVTAGLGDDGRVLISTRQTAMKTKNIERDPREIGRAH